MGRLRLDLGSSTLHLTSLPLLKHSRGEVPRRKEADNRILTQSHLHLPTHSHNSNSLNRPPAPKRSPSPQTAFTRAHNLVFTRSYSPYSFNSSPSPLTLASLTLSPRYITPSPYLFIKQKTNHPSQRASGVMVTYTSWTTTFSTLARGLRGTCVVDSASGRVGCVGSGCSVASSSLALSRVYFPRCFRILWGLEVKGKRGGAW
jgi:hypothetical protein